MFTLHVSAYMAIFRCVRYFPSTIYNKAARRRQLNLKSYWTLISWLSFCAVRFLSTTLPPSVSRLSRQCAILNISKAYTPPWPVTGIEHMDRRTRQSLRVFILCASCKERRKWITEDESHELEPCVSVFTRPKHKITLQNYSSLRNKASLMKPTVCMIPTWF
jgi:hypothetical protein